MGQQAGHTTDSVGVGAIEDFEDALAWAEPVGATVDFPLGAALPTTKARGLIGLEAAITRGEKKEKLLRSDRRPRCLDLASSTISIEA